MRYKVSGQHGTTRRRRTRTYAARSEDEARQYGAADGITVDTVDLLSPEPPSADQLALATSLGLAHPEDLDSEALSDWIARIQHKDALASPALREIAVAYGLEATEHVGKGRLFRRLFVYLNEPGRELDLAAWFTFRVFREMVKGRHDVAITTPADPAIQAIAAELLQTPGVMESIRRYSGEELIWFGQWTGSSGIVKTGGSNRTKAYKEAAERLRPLVAAEVRAEATKRHRRNPASEAETADDKRDIGSPPPQGPQSQPTLLVTPLEKRPVSPLQWVTAVLVLGLLAFAFFG
jgi:hypothetical protein